MDFCWKLVDLPTFVSPEKPGRLVVAEIGKTTEGLFEKAERVYWIVGDPTRKETRGGHRHPPGGKLEFLVCLSGKMTVKLHYPGQCGRVRLSKPNQALVFVSDVWHEITLDPGAILLSTASTVYKADEAKNDKLCRCLR